MPSEQGPSPEDESGAVASVVDEVPWSFIGAAIGAHVAEAAKRSTDA